MNPKFSILKIFFSVLSILILSNVLFSKPDSTGITHEDKLRIREALRISNDFGNLIWENFDSAPFVILLVTNENEYLINHRDSENEFVSIGYDTIIGGEIFTRQGKYNNNMLATFPAINGIPTIVIGQPENTNLTTMDWVFTVIHEHFHQLQYSGQDYYDAVNSLDLADGDETGMWMLNYKFPYDNKEISDQYGILTQKAKNTFLSQDSLQFIDNLKEYLSERKKFTGLLNEKDYKYFSFQLWQEGIARYTEIKIADNIKEIYKPSKEFSDIDDYISMDSFYSNIVSKLLRRADTQSLSKDGRNCFYTLGALEGLILDRANPDWKELYFKEKFFTEKYFSD